MAVVQCHGTKIQGSGPEFEKIANNNNNNNNIFIFGSQTSDRTGSAETGRELSGNIRPDL